MNYEYDQMKGWKGKEWSRPLARISGDGSADLVDHAVAMAFGQCRSSNYIRIQVCFISNALTEWTSIDHNNWK